MNDQTTLAVIFGNRSFFPDHLVEEGRRELLDVLEQEGTDAIALGLEDTKLGAVETYQDAQKCADLFKEHRGQIDGVLVSLANFGDERGVADTLKQANLQVPVLVQAFPDATEKMDLKNRRDSFCGKISVCNNLTQYAIPYSLTSMHTASPSSPGFREDLRWFCGVCRVVNGLGSARIGAIGARPPAFKTVRYSEKILEAYGISVETVDLSENFGRIGLLDDKDPAVREKLAAIESYIPVQDTPAEALLKMAKLAAVIEAWMAENDLVASSVQCWTAMEEFYGIVPCTVMSMMSEKLMPSACEVDICGAVAMYALQLASGTPSAIVDWNNNYGDDPDRCVVFHCSNLPKSVFEEPQMTFQDIIAGTVGQQNAYGACVGRIKPGPMTYCRASTDDLAGEVVAFIGEGEFTNDPLDTFGGRGVLHIEDLQSLLQYICSCGYEHHVAVNPSQVASVLYEAFDNYLDWEVYWHGPA